jgi:hypothetical protein
MARFERSAPAGLRLGAPLVAAASAAGILLMVQPWYGGATDLGNIHIAYTVTGWQSIGVLKYPIVLLDGACLACGLGLAVLARFGGWPGITRGLARLVVALATAAALLIAVKLRNPPSGAEIRWGAIVSLAAVLAAAAGGVLAGRAVSR